MPNKLDWLEVEIRDALQAAQAISNAPMIERYQSWLAALSEAKGQIKYYQSWLDALAEVANKKLLEKESTR